MTRTKNIRAGGCLFVCLYFLLTVSVPVGVNRFLAVQYNILARQETFLPTAGMSSNHHPPSINMTSPIVPVDEEATTIWWLSKYRKEVLWLTSEIRPGALTQSGNWKPLEFVWSLGVEFQLLRQLSSFIQDNSCLKKITNKRLENYCQDLRGTIWLQQVCFKALYTYINLR